MPLTREQSDLRASIGGLLDRYPAGQDAGDGVGARLWQRLCAEIGAAGLAIPERFDGGCAGPVEVNVVMEELGRSLTPSPMLGSAVLATQAVLGSGRGGLPGVTRRRWLDRHRRSALSAGW